MKKKLKNPKNFISREREMIGVLVLSFVIWSLFFVVDTIGSYNSNSLNSLILGVFGTLFGLLLASYAILFGLIPSLSVDLLETRAINSVNFRFFISLVANLLIIVFGFFIVFAGESYKNYFIYIQLWLVVFLVLMFSLLISYLYKLFRIAKNTALKDKKSQT